MSSIEELLSKMEQDKRVNITDKEDTWDPFLRRLFWFLGIILIGVLIYFIFFRGSTDTPPIGSTEESQSKGSQENGAQKPQGAPQGCTDLPLMNKIKDGRNSVPTTAVPIPGLLNELKPHVITPRIDPIPDNVFSLPVRPQVPYIPPHIAGKK